MVSILLAGGVYLSRFFWHTNVVRIHFSKERGRLSVCSFINITYVKLIQHNWMKFGKREVGVFFWIGGPGLTTWLSFSIEKCASYIKYLLILKINKYYFVTSLNKDDQKFHCTIKKLKILIFCFYITQVLPVYLKYQFYPLVFTNDFWLL